MQFPGPAGGFFMENRENSSKKQFTVLIVVMLLMFVTVSVLLVLSMSGENKSREKIDKLNDEVSVLKSAVQDNKQAQNENTNDELNKKLDEIREYVEALKETVEAEMGGDLAQENDVPIHGGYMIKSTEAISDAYKKGDDSALNDDGKACLKLAEKVLKKIIKDGMSDYEKELAVYEWIRDNIKHDDGVTVAIPTAASAVDNPYGVLAGKKAVCVGFATTFRLMMNMLDYDCMVIHDTDRVHSWDLIKLDGEWYHVDLYPDAESKTHNHFNLNDAAMESDWNTEFFPAATGFKYSYAYVNAEDFKSLEDASKKMRNIIEEGETASFYVRLKGDKAGVNTALLTYVSDSVTNYVDESELGMNTFVNYRVIYVSEKEYIFSFMVEVEEEDDDNNFGDDEPSENEIEEADKAFNKAFSDFFKKHEQRDDWDDDDDYNWTNGVG